MPAPTMTTSKCSVMAESLSPCVSQAGRDAVDRHQQRPHQHRVDLGPLAERPPMPSQQLDLELVEGEEVAVAHGERALEERLRVEQLCLTGEPEELPHRALVLL